MSDIPKALQGAAIKLYARQLHRRRLATAGRAAVVSLALGLLAFGATAPAAHAGVGYPGGRPYFVTAVASGTPFNHAVRLAEDRYDGAGHVHEWYWVWNQNMVDPTQTTAYYKPATGYVTNGCFAACPVRTAIGFQPGIQPKERDGTYGFNAAGQLTIRWSSGQTEAWRILQLDGLARMDLVSNSYGAIKAWSFGSKSHFGYAATLDQIKAAGTTTAMVDRAGNREKNYLTYHYDTSKGDPPDWQSTYFIPSNWDRCAASPCIESHEMTHPATTQYYAYIAGNPAVDHRKNYFNGQNRPTHDAEDPAAPCITRGGGHTYDLLQIMDDSGHFRGWVQAEASLYRKKYGQDLVSIFYTVKTGVPLPSTTGRRPQASRTATR